MSLQVLEDLCIGCGACDFSCPTGALAKTDSFLGLFAIDPYTCDDCGRCVDKVSGRRHRARPAWPVCEGKGCPLTSVRLSEFTCALLAAAMPLSAVSTLWQGPDGSWVCSVWSWDAGVVPQDPSSRERRRPGGDASSVRRRPLIAPPGLPRRTPPLPRSPVSVTTVRVNWTGMGQWRGRGRARRSWC